MSEGERDPKEEPHRRTFLAVVATGSCALAAGVAVPAAGFVASPLSDAKGGGIKVAVAKLSELEVGVPKKFSIVGDEVDAWTRAPKRKLGSVWLTRVSDREIKALSVTCPHLGCAIDLVSDDGGKPKRYECPCHDSAFDLQGNRSAGPSPRAMDPLPVEIGKADEVIVTFKRYRIGVEDREEIG